MRSMRLRLSSARRSSDPIHVPPSTHARDGVHFGVSKSAIVST